MGDVAPTLIVALDVPTSTAALAIVDRLDRHCRFYKVGSELFTAEGPAIVHRVRERGCDVFLDLKLHDIPQTVRGAARAAARMGARLITTHASGGRTMLEAAVAGAEEGAGAGCRVLAVTVLTSLDAPVLGSAWGRPSVIVEDEVVRLAGIAEQAGTFGVVCSGHEVAAVRAAHGSRLRILVPGVRPVLSASDDQARVVTPPAAARAGASYLVLGRAVTASPDPRAALLAIVESLASSSGPDYR
ncbi:MAG: orotidine-5'-phosphate decarboxylase [Gemmatimonadaceae bacterium]